MSIKPVLNRERYKQEARLQNELLRYRQLNFRASLIRRATSDRQLEPWRISDSVDDGDKGRRAPED